MTEARLLVAILEKVSSFLAKAFFPSLLEEKRNLIFNWGPERCKEGHQKLQKVINEVPTWVQRVNQEQIEKKEELSRMSLRLRKEMSGILVFRPIIIRLLCQEFLSQAKSLDFISNMDPVDLAENMSGGQNTIQSLKTHLEKVVQAFFEFLFDRNNTMLDSIDLD